MILTCPSCGTQYAVKDGAIPEGGRKVRCASCGHSWHQDPEPGPGGQEPGETAPQAPDFAPPPAAHDLDAAIPGEDIGAEPQPDEREDQPETQFDIVGGRVQAFEEVEPIAPGAPLVEPPSAVPVPPPEDVFDEGDSLAGEEPWDPAKEIPDAEEIEAVERETGGDRRRSVWMAILLAIGLVAAVFLAFWFLAPDSVRRQVGLAAAPSPLQIAPGAPERQKLASGNELVVVSGRVINPSSKTQSVPPIEAQLRDRSGKLVYRWTIAPPARSLPPGGSASFNSAEMNVPPSGLDSTVTLTLKS